MYNKDTLKNGHLKKIQMAHHRLSPVTHNMYEVISEIYRIVKRLYTWCAGNRDPWYKFTKGGGSVGDN